MRRFAFCAADVAGRACVLEEGHRSRHAVKPTAAEVLALEATHPVLSVGHQRAIDELGLPRTRYFQYLVRILDDPAADGIDQITLNRLRRHRDVAIANRQQRLGRVTTPRSTTR